MTCCHVLNLEILIDSSRLWIIIVLSAFLVKPHIYIIHYAPEVHQTSMLMFSRAHRTVVRAVALQVRAFSTPLTAAMGGGKEHLSYETVRINRTEIVGEEAKVGGEQTKTVTAAMGGGKEHLAADTLAVTRGDSHVVYGYKRPLRHGI